MDDHPDTSKYRGKCIIILIVDTGLFIFDMARTAYFIILELVTSAAGAHVKLHNQQLSSLYKPDSRTYNYVNASTNDSAAITDSKEGLTPTAILQNAKKLVKQASTTIASTIMRQSTRHDLHSAISNNSRSPFAAALIAPEETIDDLSSSTASEIKFQENKEQSESDKLIVGYVCSIVIIIIQIWACTTLWKACQPEIHPRVGSKCCRKYCNYTLFPRVPLVLFKWSIPGVIFLLGETTVVCIFGISYCLVCYHWVSEYGKELLELTSGSSTITTAAAAATAAWQNNIAFVNSTGNPDGDLDLHHISGSASGILGLNMNGGTATATTTTTTTTGGAGSYSLQDEDEEIYRRPQHEIPKHERIGLR